MDNVILVIMDIGVTFYKTFVDFYIFLKTPLGEHIYGSLYNYVMVPGNQTDAFLGLIDLNQPLYFYIVGGGIVTVVLVHFFKWMKGIIL